ncbi:hypothetical protein, variant 1 [Aphanomyces astaci]|uniref:Uncharacterized protein n=1 Tax=Aphanomyces astaci TaxID=112090 RepID=W4FDR5_APHAT|nr:hypothetical protein, variant 1 [Aphanomyces astaci]ETV64878.1 hypothetical protein, variant 1 [Aphanomyces astaci]|eukprot:XP_009845643.1 hypothetical protein, variant 1 [Aphanomyces astaci]
MSATTEALTRKLGELHEEVASLKARVVEAVRIFHGSSANASSSMSIDEAMQFAAKWCRQGEGPSEVQIRMRELEAVLTDTVAHLQPDTPHHDNQLSIATKARLQTQIQQSHEMLQLLHVLSQLDVLFQHFDAQVHANAFEVAAADVSAMDRLVRDSPSSPVMDMMRVQARMRQNQLRCLLDAEVDAVCVTSPNKLELFPPQNLWASLQAANRLAFHLDALAAAMFRHILHPLVADPTLVPQIHANTLTLLSKPPSTSSSSAPPLVPATAPSSSLTAGSFAKVLQHVLSVFQFIHAHWTDQSLLGNVLWNTHLSTPLLVLFVHNLPSSVSDLAAFKTTVQPLLHGFDASMHTIGWTTVSASTFLDHLDTRYASEKRRRVLVDVRQSMHKDYMDSVVASLPASHHRQSSSKKSGQSHAPNDNDNNNLRVSLCASKLWSQMEALLDEAAHEDVGQGVGMALVHTARDAVSLFRMGMASLVKEALEHDPRVVMLVHNDCLFLTHHMLPAVYRRKAGLPPGVSLIDLVPPLREFGEHVVMHFAKTHTHKMLQSLETSPPWTDVHEDGAFNQAETCLKVVLFQLQRIAQQWKDGGLHAYAAVVGRMLAPLLNHLLTSLLSTPPTLKAVHSVHHLFQLYLDAASDLFETAALAELHVHNWTKFALVTHMMEDTVVGVQDKWVTGVLKPVGAADVATFLKLVFPESPQRHHALSIVLRK